MTSRGYSSLWVRQLARARPAAARRASLRLSLAASRWELAVALFAIASGVLAFWVTIDAHFLAYRPWLAVQKADFILGPVGVGLYWRHRRPNNHLGLLLIVLGLIGIPYTLQSVTDPVLFGIGTMWESAIYVMTTVVILAFPSGRLDGVLERAIIAVVLVGVVLLRLVLQLTEPHFAPAFSISGCRVACPANGLAVWSTPSWSNALADAGAFVLIAVPIVIAGLLGWRFVNGTPPRRRALAIGAPIALVFLAMHAIYRTIFLLAPSGLSPSEQPVQSAVQWTFAGARAFVWYGFLLALVVAELYAGRVLRRLVRGSLARPSLPELEQLIREPLGDPSLRLGFWDPLNADWTGADGAALMPPGRGQAFTEIDRDGSPAAAIVHDAQLDEDPELLQAAGAVALLALEYAELESAWNNSLMRLAESRSRIVKAGDRERRKLERDLHDGAQQRLLGGLLRLDMARELAAGDPKLFSTLTEASGELEAAIHELRELAHGIYPTVLAESGLAGAIRGVAQRSAGRTTVSEVTERRFSSEIEAAIYYCCVEAVQNATKHAGPNSHISIGLNADARELRLEVRDDGSGFDLATTQDGVGLQNMRDRLGSVGGRIEVVSAPGNGTVVSAVAPLSAALR